VHGVTIERTSPRIRLRLTTSSDWSDIELQGFLVRAVTVIEPEGLPDDWFVTSEQIHVVQPAAAAQGDTEIQLTIDVSLDRRALSEGFLTRVQKGYIGASTLRIFALTDETASLIDELTIEGPVDGAVSAMLSPEALQEAFPLLVER